MVYLECLHSNVFLLKILCRSTYCSVNPLWIRFRPRVELSSTFHLTGQFTFIHRLPLWLIRWCVPVTVEHLTCAVKWHLEYGSISPLHLSAHLRVFFFSFSFLSSLQTFYQWLTFPTSPCRDRDRASDFLILNGCRITRKESYLSIASCV